jgi:hypothetical protein
MSLLRALWRRFFFTRVPVVGERWILDDENPFIRPVVTVLEVRGTWVQYTFGTFSSSLPISRFVAVYVPCDEVTT